jgi:D-methionine transport system ATP-binding protein
MIQLNSVSKTFDVRSGRVNALKKVGLRIGKGEIRGIIGYSGAGKSTLLRCINLLERPTEGEVVFKGEDLTKLSEKELRHKRKQMGMIFQHFNLMPSRTVYRNIAYPLKGMGLSAAEERIRIGGLLGLVGLEDKENAYPSQLSGGQKQRVAIARALASNPDVLLCDEATSALDPKTTKSILKLLKELRDKLGLTIVLITHEMEVIKEICDRVSVMEDGEIVEENSVVGIFSSPKAGITKDFLETTSNLPKLETLLSESDGFLKIKEDDILAKVQYFGETAKDAILSQASRTYGIDISVLYGSFDIIGSTPVGELIVLFSGTKEAVQCGIDYFKAKGLAVDIIKTKKERN